jgi:hypothetical protein
LAFLVLISLDFALFFCRSAAASDPKHSKQRVENEVIGDDTGMELVVPSVRVVSGLRRGKHRPRLSSQCSHVWCRTGANIALSWQAGIFEYFVCVTAPKVLKARKLNVKESSL